MYRIVFLFLMLFVLTSCQLAPANPASPPSPTLESTPIPSTPSPIPTLVPSPVPPTSTPTPIPKPTPYVFTGKVGEYTMKITCEGSGKPVILLENGLNWITWSWGRYASISQTCYYARVGMDANKAVFPRTSMDQVKELHDLLQQAKIQGPYILVGHSIAGYNLLLFTDAYPSEVAALVCVDCRYPTFDTIFYEKLKSLLAGDPAIEAKLDIFFSTYFIYSIKPGVFTNNREGLDLYTSSSQVLKVASLKDRPFVVLLASDHYIYTTNLAEKTKSRDPEKEPIMKLYEEAWVASGKELVKLSSQSRVELIENTTQSDIASHDAVSKAIQEVYDKVKK